MSFTFYEKLEQKDHLQVNCWIIKKKEYIRVQLVISLYLLRKQSLNLAPDGLVIMNLSIQKMYLNYQIRVMAWLEQRYYVLDAKVI